MVAWPLWITVNIDGVALWSPSLASCSGIFCTHRDFLKGCFVVLREVCFAFEATLIVIIYAVDYVIFFNWDYIWFESDSIHVVWLIQSRSLDVPWNLMSGWSHRLLKLTSCHFVVSYIYRKGNVIADVLS